MGRKTTWVDLMAKKTLTMAKRGLERMGYTILDGEGRYQCLVVRPDTREPLVDVEVVVPGQCTTALGRQLKGTEKVRVLVADPVGGGADWRTPVGKNGLWDMEGFHRAVGRTFRDNAANFLNDWTE